MNFYPRTTTAESFFDYIHAIREGASSIFDTDDDNIPKENFGFPSLHGDFGVFTGLRGWANPYQHFTNQAIWPRGLPIDGIKSSKVEFKKFENVRVGVWQGLADGDPDVDAIYRLTSDTPCFLNRLPQLFWR